MGPGQGEPGWGWQLVVCACGVQWTGVDRNREPRPVLPPTGLGEPALHQYNITIIEFVSIYEIQLVPRYKGLGAASVVNFACRLWARATRSSCGDGAGPQSAAPGRVLRKGWYTPRHVAPWYPTGEAQSGKEARLPHAAPTRGFN